RRWRGGWPLCQSSLGKVQFLPNLAELGFQPLNLRIFLPVEIHEPCLKSTILLTQPIHLMSQLPVLLLKLPGIDSAEERHHRWGRAGDLEVLEERRKGRDRLPAILNPTSAVSHG